MEQPGGDAGRVDCDSFHGLSEVSPAQMAVWEQTFQDFFLGHTKEELASGGARWGTWIAPVAGIPDVLRNEQLAARGFWASIDQPHGGVEVSYPGHWFLSSETESRTRCAAPGVGSITRRPVPASSVFPPRA